MPDGERTDEKPQEGTGHWWKNTWNDADDAQKEQSKRFDNKGPRRFWIPVAKTVRVIYLDEIPFQLWGHNWKANGNWRNWASCLVKNGIDKVCPGCEQPMGKGSTMKLYYAGCFTVIELTPWTDKKGVLHEFQHRLFEAKSGSVKRPGTLQRMKKLYAKHGGLKGLVVDVEREGDQSAGCGDSFEVIEKVDMGNKDTFGAFARKIGLTPEKWKANPWKVINYAEMLKPPTVEEFRSMLTQGSSSFDNSSREGQGQGGGGGDGGPSAWGNEGFGGEPPKEEDYPY